MKTILIIDDEDRVRTEVKGLLETHGYNVLEARNTDEAGDLLIDYSTGSIRPNVCHLIICDNRIREHFGNEGLGFAESLWLFGSEIPFILFTSTPLEELDGEKIRKNSIKYVSKSSQPATLYSLAIRLLAAHEL